jgi:tRNA-intron endonuclease
VKVLNADEVITATNIILSGRLATTVKKQFIIAIPKMKDKSVQFIAFDWWRA